LFRSSSRVAIASVARCSSDAQYCRRSRTAIARSSRSQG
jgi:hypothetical protein